MPRRSDRPASDRARPRYSEGRQALLDAAVTVFSRQGIAGLTYRAVADEANVTHGLVSYHFGSREVLVREALGQVLEESVEGGSLLPASGRLDDFAQELPGLTAADPDNALAQFDLVVHARRQTVLVPETRRLYAAYIAVCAEALERFGAEPDAAFTRLVFAAVDGLVLQQLVTDDEEATRESLERLREVIARAVDAGARP